MRVLPCFSILAIAIKYVPVAGFKNETFKAVAAALERRYAVRIRVASEIQDCRIYATIGNGPVQQALQALALLMQAELSGSGEEFSFSGNKCQ